MKKRYRATKKLLEAIGNSTFEHYGTSKMEMYGEWRECLVDINGDWTAKIFVPYDAIRENPDYFEEVTELALARAVEVLEKKLGEFLNRKKFNVKELLVFAIGLADVAEQIDHAIAFNYDEETIGEIEERLDVTLDASKDEKVSDFLARKGYKSLANMMKGI
mgnify:CR=1 FL=1